MRQTHLPEPGRRSGSGCRRIRAGVFLRSGEREFVMGQPDNYSGCEDVIENVLDYVLVLRYNIHKRDFRRGIRRAGGEIPGLEILKKTEWRPCYVAFVQRRY